MFSWLELGVVVRQYGLLFICGIGHLEIVNVTKAVGWAHSRKELSKPNKRGCARLKEALRGHKGSEARY